MSRRLLSAHCRVPLAAASDNNPYQPTTVPVNHSHVHQRTAPLSYPKQHRDHHDGQYQIGFRGTIVNGDLSEDTLTDSQSYYDYYHGGYHHSHKDGGRYCSDRSFSDESGSTRLPAHYENDNESCRRLSRNTFSSDGRNHSSRRGRDKVKQPIVHKDVRRVFPQQYVPVDPGVYQEIPQQQICEPVPVSSSAPRRVPNSRLSDRPQSSMSSGVTSAIVDGCGGKCQTFENVCYFFLQLVFMMGILIGVSLCIAGLVLRKSAARNLQVLVYIGVLLAIVSAVLLGIQWNARNAAKKRKLAVRNAKRAPIPLETIHPRNQQLQQPLMAVQNGQRIVPQVMIALPPQPDQQGIPWWRRKDLT